MIYGTHHFTSFAKACMYYSQYEPKVKLEDIVEAVNRKIAEGSISIGRPKLKTNEELFLLDEGARYGIREVKRV